MTQSERLLRRGAAKDIRRFEQAEAQIEFVNVQMAAMTPEQRLSLIQSLMEGYCLCGKERVRHSSRRLCEDCWKERNDGP